MPTFPAHPEQVPKHVTGREHAAGHMPKLPVLDGWRGISIFAVFMSHMLPLGSKALDLNETFGVLGMAIFFTLSGFLITSTLYFNPSVRSFAIRRILRIVPAAWLFLTVALTLMHAPLDEWTANLFFYSNLPPFHLGGYVGHLWSLCVEMQFYAAIGILFLLLRRRGLALLPFLCLAITCNRIYSGHWLSIVTLYRVDEILSGASLAYLFHSPYSANLKRALSRIHPAFPLLLLFLSCDHRLTWLNYLRPYFAATMVGATLFRSGTAWNRVLESRPLAYIASISYAFYVWHPITVTGWLNSGTKLVIYAKRPLAIALSVLIAHVSTFYYEKFFINLGKRLTARPRVPAATTP